MIDLNDLYCHMYVESDGSRQELSEVIAQAINGTLENFTVVLPLIEVDIRKNKDFDEALRKEFPDGFLYFRYSLDIDASPGQTLENQIKMVADILEHLWSRGYPAVAACDYEDELPHKGGYKSHDVPWVKTEVKIAG